VEWPKLCIGGNLRTIGKTNCFLEECVNFRLLEPLVRIEGLPQGEDSIDITIDLLVFCDDTGFDELTNGEAKI
jgi:hypothetical protein